MTVDYFRGRRDRRRARAELDDDAFDDSLVDDAFADGFDGAFADAFDEASADGFDDAFADDFDDAFADGFDDAFDGAFDREFAYALLAASISGSDQRRSSSRVGAE